MMRRLILPAVLIAAAFVPGSSPADPAPADPIAHLQVRTLVMDALGTRTVDVATARVPYNSTGLLMRQVPYGGPPLSYRLLVRPETPTDEGIRLVMSTEVWSGTLAGGLNDSVARREESAVIAPESSYLLELAHERPGGIFGAGGGERRVVLSITLSDEGDSAGPGQETGPLRAVHFVFQMIRQNGPVVDPPETHVLSSLVGRPVSYASSMVALAGGKEGALGLTFTLMAEGTQGDLVTVRLKVSGFDYEDAERTRLVPVAHESLHTVRAGSSFLVEIPVGEEPLAGTDESPSPERHAVSWVVNVSPRLT